jgi:hypothetical protein
MCHLITIGSRESREAIVAYWDLTLQLGFRPVTIPQCAPYFRKRTGFLRSWSDPVPAPLSRASLHIRSTISCADDKSATASRVGLTGRLLARSRRHGSLTSAPCRSTQHQKQQCRQQCRHCWTVWRRPGGVRVFIHSYSGSFDTEVVNSARVVRISSEQLRNPDDIAEDQLCEIVSPSD